MREVSQVSSCHNYIELHRSFSQYPILSPALNHYIQFAGSALEELQWQKLKQTQTSHN